MTMFWLATLRMQGLRNQISLLDQRLETIAFDQSVFQMIVANLECEVVVPPQTVLSQCAIRGGLIGDGEQHSGRWHTSSISTNTSTRKSRTCTP